MSVREQLEDALKNVPVVINDFWYTADEFEALGFTGAPTDGRFFGRSRKSFEQWPPP